METEDDMEHQMVRWTLKNTKDGMDDQMGSSRMRSLAGPGIGNLI